MSYSEKDTLLILPGSDEARETITEHLFSAAVISAIAGQWGAVKRDSLLTPMSDNTPTS